MIRSAPVDNYDVEPVAPVIRVTCTMASAASTLHLTEVGGYWKTVHWENVTRIFQNKDGSWRRFIFTDPDEALSGRGPA